VLQPGLPRAVVRAEDAAPVRGSIASGAVLDRGAAVGPVVAGLEQAASTSEAVTAASHRKILTRAR
jgi:hypothetical protein